MNVVSGTCLMPPPLAMMAEIDGDAERFYELYTEHLLSDVQVDFLSVIIGFLHQGGNITLLIPAGFEEPWVNILYNHMSTYYGIYMGTETTQFGYNMAFDNMINDILYSGGFISPMEYLKSHDIHVLYPEWIIAQLQSQLKYITDNPQIDFNNISILLKSNPNATLAVSFNPFKARSEIL